MQKVYTNENYFLVNNVKNLIEAQKIGCFIKNEFSQGAVGEISAFDAWPEVWIFNDADFERALEIVNLSPRDNKMLDWICCHCAEKNDSAFEICWNCQLENTSSKL